MVRWVCLVLAILGFGQARSQTLPNPSAPKPASPQQSVTQADAKAVLDVINDPGKRAALAAALGALSSSARPGTATATPAKDAAPPPPSDIGAQALHTVGAYVENASGQFAAFAHSIGALPSVWNFSLRVIRNPDARGRAQDGAIHLVATLGAALLVEYAVWRIVRPAYRRIAETAPAGGRGATEDDPEAAPDAEIERVARHRRFERALRALRRLPFVLLRLVLDLLPVAAFLGVGFGGTFFATLETQQLISIAVQAYVICRVATCLARMLVSPDSRHARLLPVSDAAAAAFVRWVRRLVAVGAFGFSAMQMGALFGMPAPAQLAFIKSVVLLDHLLLAWLVLRSRRTVARWIRAPDGRRGIGAELRNRFAGFWHLVAIFYILGLWVVWAASIRNGYLRIWHLFLVTAAVLAVARLISIVLLGFLDRVFSPGAAPHAGFLETRGQRYHTIARATLSLCLVAATLVALIQVWGWNATTWFQRDALGNRLVAGAVTIAIAALVATLIWEGANAAFDRELARLGRQNQYARAARLRTLIPILRTTLLFALLAIFGLTALSEIGVNIAPLLAGAGILGVAIGFGSQKLVQDFITGIFLLFENAMQVGDWVTVAGLSGSVENLSIRTMRLRAGDGSVHIIPFSAVSTVTNVNRGVGNAAVSVAIPADADTDHACEILSEIAREMRREDRFEPMMNSDLQLWGVDSLTGGLATITGQIVCTDAGRWAVQREFNRRLNIRFKEAGIPIGAPGQTIFVREAPRPAERGRLASDRQPQPQPLEPSPPPAALGNTS